ncbi:transcription elongation factor GreAB [Oleiharenicola sp. Vm1]|uniref:transcription elongation factor GreAB n=1 Tax=Oleiharenicola sp. Vm1 TaxID=3398393 RepID=UPI0039F518F8
MTKRALLDQLIAHLTAEVEAMTKAALATHAEATDDENKAEDKYDTRGLEASYLAHGQSKAAEEAAQAVAQFRALPVRDFTAADPIGLGALVVLESKGAQSRYFIGPRAGGTEVEIDGQSVMVVTPQSPLGRQLLGRKLGDVLLLDVGGRKAESRIAAVL